MNYFHVDVFSEKPMTGNGLTVVFPNAPLNETVMLDIAKEFKQFETIFLFQDERSSFTARIFTVDEELGFAGHPILGAAAVVHQIYFSHLQTATIRFQLSGRSIEVQSETSKTGYQVVMNQGTPEFITQVESCQYESIAKSLNNQPVDIDKALPLEVVSTGLPYLLVPLKSDLHNVKISIPNFEVFLSNFRAKFVYIFNTETLECRTWDNNGLVEDIATGSAAGPLCAYLVKHGIKAEKEVIRLRQGSFVGRPSVIEGWADSSKGTTDIFIRGRVSFFAQGRLSI
ncbi:PhzF family phenazine biosynthesis protein [Acetanaerobacterium elongatum]|uniref:Phenazine biosynthesis protein PhzF family n=1 Tax=Acetanaerobacterium elongatum TaxID=258515 RepID=A0A1G9ZBP4_9FIRM|nr:PhzF family phenazine biosynthesis protein [Acetanaerobacterium elongatum]SDN18832.1 phenazine biosynthesis protein PhzF family [Acetanaerobacterium elongatum]